MVARGNFETTKKRLVDYIDGNDYSRPFIIVGWASIGKSALVGQVVKEKGLKEGLDVKVDNYTMRRNFTEERRNDVAVIMELCREVCYVPHVVTIDVNLTPAEIREVALAGYDINIQELDTAEWLEWAKGGKRVHQEILRFLEAEPDGMHENIKQWKMFEQKIAQAFDEIIADDGSDVNRLVGKLKELFDLHRFCYLADSDIAAQWNRVQERIAEISKNVSQPGKQKFS